MSYNNICITHGLCFLLSKLHINDAVNRSGLWWKKVAYKWENTLTWFLMVRDYFEDIYSGIIPYIKNWSETYHMLSPDVTELAT
jgi:hypothetical protein